jgi:2-polyprenyl-6-methoxyphenol hydroxylase-like FAD-dependent oxidoreductase
VGAGPTGLTAACELGRRGATVRIIDRAPQRSRATKASGIQPRTVELLDRLVITDRIDTTIVNVALPTFVRDLGASTRDLQWIVRASLT